MSDVIRLACPQGWAFYKRRDKTDGCKKGRQYKPMPVAKASKQTQTKSAKVKRRSTKSQHPSTVRSDFWLMTDNEKRRASLNDDEALLFKNRASMTPAERARSEFLLNAMLEQREASTAKPVRRTRIDQAAASVVGDKRADIEGFKSIMADSHRELSQRYASENDALRNLLGQFGVNGKQIGGFLSKMRAAKDADAIKRFDEMVEMAARDYPKLLEYEPGGTAEEALFHRLQRGLRPMPKIHDDVVIQDAKDKAGLSADGTYSPRSHRVDNSLLQADFLSLNGWRIHRAVRLGWVADVKTKSKTGKWIGVGEHQGQVRYQKSKPGERKHAAQETTAKKTAPEVRPTPELGSPDGGGDQRTDGRDEPKRLVTARAEFTSPANPEWVPESLREHLTEEQLFGAAKGIESLDNHGGFLLADGTGCVAPWTRIYNPVTNVETTIQKLAENGSAHVVLSLTPDGLQPQVAECPFQKGVEILYEVETDGGRKITVTGQHRFLTPDGWRKIDEGFSVGSLLGCAVRHQASISGTCRPIHVSSADRSLKKPEDCLDDYSACRRPCDGQPQTAQDINREPIPSQAGVHEHNRLSWQTDDEKPSREHSHLCQLAARRSRNDSSPMETRDHVSTLCQKSAAHVRQWPYSLPGVQPSHAASTINRSMPAIRFCREKSFDSRFQTSRQSRETSDTSECDTQKTLSSLRSLEPFGRYCNRRISHHEAMPELLECAFPCVYSSGWDRVRSIREIGRLPFYDMHVPGPENYVAEGIVNHNSGKSRQQLAIAEKYAREGKKVLLVTMPGVIRPDWKTGEFGGSFHDDSSAMGIKLNLYRGGEMANGAIHLATYNHLARIKDHVDGDTVVIFDESHNIKASSSGMGKHGHDVSEAAGKVMYATATPADRPADIAYLFRIIPDEQTIGSKRETKEQLTDKWNRVQALNARHSAVVEAIQQDASAGNVNAAVSLLMAHTAIRVGRARNEKEWGTFGAVTLEGRHVRQRPDGSVVVSFIGKKSIRNTVKINDPFLAKELLRRKELAGPKGKMFDTSYATVRKYLQRHQIHAHDLRRSVGTTLAAQLINAQPLPEDKNEQREFLNGVFDQVAARLGNTRYVARDAYIDPALLAMMPAHHPKSTKQRVKAELKRMAAGAKPGDMVKTISRWFDDITAAGLMVKREISMDGMSVGVSRMTLPDHAQAQLDEIDRKFATAYVKPGHAGLAEAQALMHKSRLIETFKVPHTVDMVRKSLASGKQVVIFAERVNESDIEIFTDAGKKEIIAQSEGTMKLLREHLQAAGIHDIAEIHGGVTNEYSRESQKRFQAGHARVVIASPGAAGTGINLDDRHGDKPRELIMMSPPLSAIQGTQVAGRIWRLKTKCPVTPCASIKYVLSNTQNDNWRWEINKNKMQSLGAIVEGELQTLVNVPDQMALNGRLRSYVRVTLMGKRRKLSDGWHEIRGEGLEQPWLYYSGGKVTKRQKTKPKGAGGEAKQASKSKAAVAPLELKEPTVEKVRGGYRVSAMIGNSAGQQYKQNWIVKGAKTPESAIRRATDAYRRDMDTDDSAAEIQFAKDAREQVAAMYNRADAPTTVDAPDQKTASLKEAQDFARSAGVIVNRRGSVPAWIKAGKEALANQATSKAKEPWEMTVEGWSSHEASVFGDKGKPPSQSQREWHKGHVRDALVDGKPVPSFVLNEYPDLKEKYGKKEARISGPKKVKPPTRDTLSTEIADLAKQMKADGITLNAHVDRNGNLSLDHLLIGDESRHRKGAGTKAFVDIVNAAKARGIKAITLEATRGDDLNGYYTFARLGADGPLPKHLIVDAAKDGFKVRNVSDLMATPKGVAWWKENGDTMDMEFDLSDSSESMKDLSSYVKSKSAATPTSQKGLLGESYAPGKFTKAELQDLTGATDSPKSTAKQKAMFDTGKNDLPGQELLFDTDAPPLYETKPKATNKPDQAIVNVSLDKRGGGSLNAQIDRHKAEQAKTAKAKRKSDAVENREAKAQAKKLFAEFGQAIADSTAKKHGVSAKEAIKTLESMVKHGPTKALKMLQGYKPSEKIEWTVDRNTPSIKWGKIGDTSIQMNETSSEGSPYKYKTAFHVNVDRDKDGYPVAKQLQAGSLAELRAMLDEAEKNLASKAPPKSLSLRPRLFTPCTLADLNGPTRMATDWHYAGRVIRLGKKDTATTARNTMAK